MNPVQQKISCVYIIGVSDEKSTKRKQQSYKVTATNELHSRAQNDEISSAKPTEKMDGTCCLVDLFQGKPWLWARYDRKPNKVGEKKFSQYKRSQQNIDSSNDTTTNSVFSWNPETDFKDVPPHWIPASRLKVVDGFVVPDKLGHTPGWVPLEHTSRQHCWHLSAVHLEAGLALVLRESEQDCEDLVLEAAPLSNLIGQTCELVGTNINGNPYGVGNKKTPLHFLVPHGSLSLASPSPVDRDSLVAWMESEAAGGAVEGIVWHCPNGELYKLHRHHVGLPWPVDKPRLSTRQVKVRVELLEVAGSGGEAQKPSVFSQLLSLNGQNFESLCHLHSALCSSSCNDAES